MGYIKVADRTGLYRDSSTGAIVNRDNAARENYLKRKQIVETQKQHQQAIDQQITRINNRIDSLESKLDVIVSLLSNR